MAAVNKQKTMLSDRELFEIEDDYCQIDEDLVEEEYEPLFRSLHTLSSRYRDLFVDYYIGEMSVKQLAEKYFLTETTVKWRLNVGRSRIRERIGVNRMDKVYKRINWNTNGCNGSMDSDRYLHTQIARAICQAAYEKPLTVEEISLCTGIPAMYIEDELPRLEYGDAIQKTGNKYATDFIIFRLQDRADTEAALDSMVRGIEDYCLHSQINQWVFIYCGEIVGQVVEELIHRGRLRKPGAEIQKTGQAGSEQAEHGNQKIQEERPLVDGIFYVEGEYMLI